MKGATVGTGGGGRVASSHLSVVYSRLLITGLSPKDEVTADVHYDRISEWK